eukprot:2531688-Heterocapsa_arctica.AAC.3
MASWMAFWGDFEKSIGMINRPHDQPGDFSKVVSATSAMQKWHALVKWFTSTCLNASATRGAPSVTATGGPVTFTGQNLLADPVAGQWQDRGKQNGRDEWQKSDWGSD